MMLAVTKAKKCLIKAGKFLFFTSFIFLFSCEDIIEISVPDSKNKQLVVNAILKSDTNKIGNHIIKLSLSQNYENQDNNVEELIGMSKVRLLSSCNDSIIVPLELAKGYYVFPKNKIEYNCNYKLEIETTEGKKYQSTFQKSLKPIDIDSVAVLSSEYLREHGYQFSPLINSNDFYPALTFKDREGEENFYAWILSTSLNTNLLNMRTYSDVEFGDGKTIPFEYSWLNNPVLENSNFNIEQWTFNKNFYKYVQEIQNLQNQAGPFAAPPSNPISNISNINDPSETVLGFFEIISITYKSN